MSLWRRIMDAAAGFMRPGEQRIFVSPRQAGVLVTEDTALTLPEWWACVNVIARTVAALPWGVYKRTDSGRELVDGSIAWLLNNQPNPEMTAFSFREALVAHLLNWGNGYAEIQRDASNRPVALWPITPDRACPERDSSGALVYRVRSDMAGEVFIAAADMFHVHGIGFDGLVGYSPVRMAARSIGIGIAQDTFAQAFYANGTQMGSLVELPGGMTKQQVADAEAVYNEKHQGPSKAFRVKVGPAGTKVHPMGMPMTDAQFIESRQMTVTMAARWLGVPPHKIADLTRSTNNNIEHQGIEFVTDAIVPWAVRFEQEANAKLFSARAQGRVYTKLSVAALMRGDSKARAEFYKTMLAAGVMSVNEVRALEELNGIGAAGDAHLVQLNQTTLEWLVKNPDAKASAPAAPAPMAPANFSVTLPTFTLSPVTNLTLPAAAASAIQIDNHVPPSQIVVKAPITIEGSTVNVPPTNVQVDAPVVNIGGPTVNVEPAQITLPAPQVNVEPAVVNVAVEAPAAPDVHIAPAVVNVLPADVRVDMPPPVVNVAVQPADVRVDLPAPVVNVQAPVVNVAPATVEVPAPIVNVAAPVVNVTAPETETEQTIERDKNGDIARVVTARRRAR